MKKRLRKILPLTILSTFFVGVIDLIWIVLGKPVQSNNTILNFVFNLLGVQTSLFPAVETSAQTFNQPLWFTSVIIVCYLLFCLWRTVAVVNPEVLGNDSITFSIFVAMPLCVLCNKLTIFQTLLEFPVIRFLGKISFSVFVWNFPIQIGLMTLAEKANWLQFDTWYIWLLNFVVTVIIGYISYISIENKGIK